MRTIGLLCEGSRGGDMEAATTASSPDAASTMSFFSRLLDTSDFPPRWECGTWSDQHGWLHIVSDFAIFGAYLAIPVVLMVFALRRDDIPYPPILWLFAAFIGLCGLGHLVEGTIFWKPWYRLSGLVKVCTAVASWGTVVALARVAPSILALPGQAQQIRHLGKEVEQREQAESDALRRNEKLEQANQEMRAVTGATVGRELRILELKREVNELSAQLGREVPYSVELEQE